MSEPGPWERACRAAWGDDIGKHRSLLLHCKSLDRAKTPAIERKPGYVPVSRFLRSMYGLPPEGE